MILNDSRQFRRPNDFIATEAKSFGIKWDTLKNFNKLAVEIGCGVGWHAIQYAINHPETGVIAIERTTSKFQRFERRFQHHAIPSNLIGVHADATLYLDQNFKDNSIDEVFILYPNPEPKAANQRWMRSLFMRRLIELMKHGSRLHIATNIASYANETAEFASTFGFHVTDNRKVNRLDVPSFKPQTHFEKKYFLRGDTLFLLSWQLSKTSLDKGAQCQ